MKRTVVPFFVCAGFLCRIVCSDAMARGLDIPRVAAVINYDMPQSVEAYVHRVGRTARAGHSGDAFTVLTGPEVRPFREIMKRRVAPNRVQKVTFSLEEEGTAVSDERYRVRSCSHLLSKQRKNHDVKEY